MRFTVMMKAVILVSLMMADIPLVSHLAPVHAAAVPLVRLALVNVPDDLLRPLLPDFEKQLDLRAEIVYTGNDPFSVAREGKADLVISHYGHEGVEPFITAGFGLWPHPVFANQVALLRA